MKFGKKHKHVGAALFAAVIFAVVSVAELSAQDASPPKTTAQAARRPVMKAITGAPEIKDLHYRDAELQVVLRQLSAAMHKNIVPTREVTGKVSADFYGVTFREALQAVLNGAGYVHVEKGNFIYVYTPKQLEDVQKAQRVMGRRTYRLSYVTAGDAKALLVPMLTADSRVAISPAADMGISTSSTEAGGNTNAAEDVLVVRDYEDSLRYADTLIRQLDVKPDQVLIEATILRATLTEDNALGIDFNTLAGIDFDALASSTPGVQSLTTGTANVSALDLAAASFRTDFNSAIAAGGFTGGVITNNIAFFVRALETVTDVTVLANPSLLVVNKQRGEIMIGNRDGYLTTTITETVATQTVQFLETGTQLVVRPYIAKNGYIRMELHPEDSSGSVGANGLPSETTTEVTTNVLVRDGHTIVIGGLFREQTSNNRGQIPLLGNIPYVGTLFRRSVDNTTREEIVILITPRIIKQEADESVSEQMKDDVERFRIGQRKGLQWWGRSRLAQSHMRWAKQELRAGRSDKALWNVDMAISLNPRMEEAIRFKERLTERAFWSDQARVSSIKYFIQRMVMQDLGFPVERIIIPEKPRDAEKVDRRVRKALGIAPRPEDPLPQPARPMYPVQQEGVKSDTVQGDEEEGGNAPEVQEP